ncbi:uncharacterized protein LOC125109845 [Lutra lutra]|uniref:uncharacterized protein LOC125109845 n=1 Tax=Lutra lutra TaxID=9657 RepID=UPI001FD4640E|nr:uncharacterized protein LOC125109845 [Lutra lutra]
MKELRLRPRTSAIAGIPRGFRVDTAFLPLDFAVAAPPLLPRASAEAAAAAAAQATAAAGGWRGVLATVTRILCGYSQGAGAPATPAGGFQPRFPGAVSSGGGTFSGRSHGVAKKSTQKVLDPEKDGLTRLKHLRALLGAVQDGGAPSVPGLHLVPEEQAWQRAPGTHSPGHHHPVQCCGQLHHHHVPRQPKHDSLGQGHGGGPLDPGGQGLSDPGELPLPACHPRGSAECPHSPPEENMGQRFQEWPLNKFATLVRKLRRAWKGLPIKGVVLYLGTFFTDLLMLETAVENYLEGKQINYSKKNKVHPVLPAEHKHQDNWPQPTSGLNPLPVPEQGFPLGSWGTCAAWATSTHAPSSQPMTDCGGGNI